MSETAAQSAITPLKRVSAYRTSDGAIHETRSVAELREAEIALDRLVDGLALEREEQPLSGVIHDHADDIHAALSRLLKAQKKARVEVSA